MSSAVGADGPYVVVVSAHAADFVWRSGGAIAPPKSVRHAEAFQQVFPTVGGTLW